MITEWKKDETPKQQTAAEPGSVSAATQNILEKKSFEAYGQAEQVVGDVYNKTTQKVSETYDSPWESLDHSLFSRYFW